MLSYFTIQNFKSILDLNLDLSFAEGRAPNCYKDMQVWPFLGENHRLVPVLALYGANASGKTNVLQALAVFMRTVVGGIHKKYWPNKLNPKYNATTFEIGFYKDDVLYIYLLKYNQSTILHEGLYKQDKEHVIFEIKDGKCNFSEIATMEYTAQRLEEIYRVECQNEMGHQWISFFTRAARNYKGLNQELISVWMALTDLMSVYPDNDIPLPYVLEMLAGGDSPEKIAQAFDRITKILKKLDIDINKLTLNRMYKPIKGSARQTAFSDDATTFYKSNDDILVADCIRSYHTDINGREVVFNFNEESDGTQILVGLLGLCLYSLDHGRTLCIDELDKSLHSRLFIEVVRMFKDKRYNKNNAQLIFTAHNTDILDDGLMRVSEVGLVNRTEKQGSTIRRIVDFENKDNVNNFRSQYLSGAFSGVPYPYI